MTANELSPGQAAALIAATQTDGGTAGQLTCRWDILDDTHTTEQLKTEGRARLADLVDRLEIVLIAARWSIDGDHLRLVADVVFWPAAGWDGNPIITEDPAPQAAA